MLNPIVKDEILVKREVIMALFNPPLPKSTFHDRVKRGEFASSKVPGHYLLNATRKKLGMPLLDAKALRAELAQADESERDRQLLHAAFPDLSDNEPLRQRIRELGESLDAHRKARQAAHPDLTMTGMYNVLEKLRTGEELDAKDRKIHHEGLVSVLKQLHDELDADVLHAYGWDDLITPAAPLADRLARSDADAEALEQQILLRLVDLNHARAEEEQSGLVRWLRPEYQNPAGTQPQKAGKQAEMDVDDEAAATAEKLAWPDSLPERFAAVKQAAATVGTAPAALAACFGRRTKKRIEEITAILRTLESLGQL